MPRKSATSLLVTFEAQQFERPEPPSELAEEQRVEWRIVVSRMPADWFPPETLPLLKQYVRMVCRARDVARMIEVVKGDDSENAREELKNLLRLEVTITGQIGLLSTKMRLSQQSNSRVEYTRKLSLLQAAGTSKKALWD